MSALTDRISEVLREVIRTELGLRSGEYFPSAVFDKAAAAVAEALQLTEETQRWRIHNPTAPNPKLFYVFTTENDARTALLALGAGWVPGWTTEQEKS